MSTFKRIMNKIKKEQDEIDKYYNLSYDKKLEMLLKQYGNNIDSDTLKFIIQSEFSDVIYNQHMKSCYPMDAIMISTQLICCILNIIIGVINPEAKIILGSFSMSFISLVVLIFILCNNYIHNKNWYNAKKRLAKINVALDMLPVRAKTELIQELKEKYNIDVGDIIDKEE